ncbi:MAG: HAD family phosphatase [bacterium]|nr:HAD family phosphatase [bacterium]
MSDTNKKFAAFDIDGTLFRGALFRELIYDLLADGAVPNALTKDFEEAERAWKTRQHVNAFHEYEEAMISSFDSSLVEVSFEAFEKAAIKVIDRVGDYVYAYTRDLAAALKKQGYTLIAISGSPQELVEPFVAKYGFDIFVAQQYGRGDNGKFNGEVTKTHTGKDVILKKLIEEHGLSLEGSVAVGDTGGDIGMLSIVEKPIAFNPEKKLFEAAKENSWNIVVERKNMIYKLSQNEPTFVLA